MPEQDSDYGDWSAAVAGNPTVRTIQITPATPGVIPPRKDRVLLVFWSCNGVFTLFPDSQTVSDLVGLPFEAFGPSTGLGHLPLVINEQTWEGAAKLGWTLTSTANTGVTIIEQYRTPESERKTRRDLTIRLKVR